MSAPARFRPAAGRRALKPSGEPLAAAGEPLVLTPYWARLLADGDIEPVPAKSKPRKAGASEGSKST